MCDGVECDEFWVEIQIVQRSCGVAGQAKALRVGKVVVHVRLRLQHDMLLVRS